MKLKRPPFVLRDQERDARLKLYGSQSKWRTRPLDNKGWHPDADWEDRQMKRKFGRDADA